MAILLIKKGGAGDVGKKIALEAGRSVTVGRSAGNALVLADNLVSRQHAEVRAENGGFVVVDKGSSFGTMVNGAKISAPTALKAGDEILCRFDQGLGDVATSFV